MAEVTGNTPVEYRATTELPQQTAQSGWETRTQSSQEEKGEDYTPVQQVVAEFIGTFAFLSVAVCTTYWWYPDFAAMGLAACSTMHPACCIMGHPDQEKSCAKVCSLPSNL